MGQDHMQRIILEMQLTAGEVVTRRWRAFIYYTKRNKRVPWSQTCLFSSSKNYFEHNVPYIWVRLNWKWRNCPLSKYSLLFLSSPSSRVLCWWIPVVYSQLKKAIATSAMRTIRCARSLLSYKHVLCPDGLYLSIHGSLHCFYRHEHSSKIYGFSNIYLTVGWYCFSWCFWLKL